jgi:2,3-bisphosphoglycerate-independent phosphoglycerate mutase
VKAPKFIVLVGDGMADYRIDALDGRTPLEAARTPHLDRLAAAGQMGLVRTIPEGMEPGSDIANMSLLGYDPRRYHTGRAPLEAASLGVRLDPQDVAFRCNLVTLLEDDRGVLRMADYSAGHISTEDAREVIAALQERAVEGPLRLYAGVSYRHLLVWRAGRDDLQTTPPHDITGEPAEPHRRVYREAPPLQAFVERAAAVLAEHPVNRRRQAEGKRPANGVWLWGQGKAPSLPTLETLYGLRGAMISAVDLLKGLGVYAGLDPIAVPGATGYLDTNYRGKVEAALSALETGDFVYLHVEAPDEAGHEGSLEKKIQAIEDLDAKVVGPLIAGAVRFPDVRILVVSDHLTPVSVRTHVSDPTIFLLASLPLRTGANPSGRNFCEKTAETEGLRLPSGEALFRKLIGR